MTAADHFAKAKQSLEDLGSAAVHRIGARAAERLVDDVVEVLSEHAAELARAQQERDELSEQLDWHIDKVRDLLNAERERDEARAENERLRLAASNFLASPHLAGYRHDLQAALAAAQEPPAEPTGLHLDPCACGHDHAAGREGTCGSFLCGCRKWEPPVDRGDR